jgi:hydrogenase maturation protease
MSAPATTLVMGVGNILWADEGFGVRCAEAFNARFADLPGLEVLDGGTQGLALLGRVMEAERLLIFDALDFGLAPGTLLTLRGDEVPRAMARNQMSLHQASMMELLAMAAMLGRTPERLTVIGLQPILLDDYGGSLTPEAEAAVPVAVARAEAELAGWGLRLAERSDAARPLLADALAADSYARGRPDAAAACRVGDARFLPAGMAG